LDTLDDLLSVNCFVSVKLRTVAVKLFSYLVNDRIFDWLQILIAEQYWVIVS